ncbi:serine/threonine-protein kinase haspin [Porphyrio hochstetteri]
MPFQPRLLRTYSRRGGYVRPLPQPDRWISPPQDRKGFFSSTSAGSSAVCTPSDDPDYSPTFKRRFQPLSILSARSRRLRTRGGAAKEKENRPAGPATPGSPSPFPAPRGAARRRRRRRRRRQGPPRAAQRPLLCSTPQCPRLSRRWAPLGDPGSLIPLSAEGGSTPDGSPELHSPPRRALPRRALRSLESSQGDSDWLSPLPRAGGPRQRGGGRARSKGESRELGAGREKSGRVLRASVRGWAQDPLSPQKAITPPPAVSTEPCAGAASDRPRDDLRRESRKGSRKGSLCSPQGESREHQLMPVVVLDRREVPLWLMSVKEGQESHTDPAYQQPMSPPGCQGNSGNKYKGTKVVSGGGSTCRKACISGSSASRWGRQIRLRPKRLKNKRWQKPNNSFLRPQRRQKRIKRSVLEMSVDMKDSDYSVINNSYSWRRVRASLSFHKKKKVTSEESLSDSILCTPSVQSQPSGHQGTFSASKAQDCSWSASSMVLLAPRDSSFVSELMLTDAEKVFGECQQDGPIAFEEYIPSDKMKDCKKIGEGVFGEVFQIDSERGPVALKIIPIEGPERINGEAQKSFREILPEIIISKELSLLSEESVNSTVGFITLYSVHCVQGAYPKYLLDAWDRYHEERGSENDRPDFFGDKQLFMVLEFEFGGNDLENMKYKFNSITSAKSILHQVTASLAVAEQELHFEHRDLHWGNVLVKRTDVKELSYVLNGATHRVPTAGIHVNIIDYTLSRLEKDGLTVFCDLSTDEELFQGIGDYQFDIYRQMKAENSNNWTDYHPHSNVLWLHYLSYKLLKDMRYKKVAKTSAMKKLKQQLSRFHKEVLTFGSANEVLQKSSLFQ